MYCIKKMQYLNIGTNSLSRQWYWPGQSQIEVDKSIEVANEWRKYNPTQGCLQIIEMCCDDKVNDVFIDQGDYFVQYCNSAIFLAKMAKLGDWVALDTFYRFMALIGESVQMEKFYFDDDKKLEEQLLKHYEDNCPSPGFAMACGLFFLRRGNFNMALTFLEKRHEYKRLVEMIKNDSKPTNDVEYIQWLCLTRSTCNFQERVERLSKACYLQLHELNEPCDECSPLFDMGCLMYAAHINIQDVKKIMRQTKLWELIPSRVQKSLTCDWFFKQAQKRYGCKQSSFYYARTCINAVKKYENKWTKEKLHQVGSDALRALNCCKTTPYYHLYRARLFLQLNNDDTKISAAEAEVSKLSPFLRGDGYTEILKQDSLTEEETSRIEEKIREACNARSKLLEELKK